MELKYTKVVLTHASSCLSEDLVKTKGEFGTNYGTISGNGHDIKPNCAHRYLPLKVSGKVRIHNALHNARIKLSARTGVTLLGLKNCSLGIFSNRNLEAKWRCRYFLILGFVSQFG